MMLIEVRTEVEVPADKEALVYEEIRRRIEASVDGVKCEVRG